MNDRQRRAMYAKTRRQEPGRVRGHARPVSPAHNGRDARSLLRQRFPNYTRHDHAAAAARFRASADNLESAWGTRYEAAFKKTHGRKPHVLDYRISGVGDDRLPEADKRVLRGLAQRRTEALSLADAHEHAGRHLRSNP